MTPPYVIKQVTVSSGNACRVKVFNAANRIVPAECVWDEDPTDAEIAECNQWMIENVFKGMRMLSMRVENQQDADELIQSVQSPTGRNPGAN